MKNKIIVSVLGLSLALTSCEDMLAPESDLVTYPEDHQLNTPNDTLYSVVGAIKLMQEVADRTNLLGEIRADLVSLTDKASLDLQELANFNVSEGNIYNKPEDYYAIINNCNYFIDNVDPEFRKQGIPVYERELAVMHSFRAWAYLQLCLIYGDIPFYTKFLGTQLDAETVMKQPKKSLQEVCEWLIADLIPWKDVRPWTINGSIVGYSSDRFTFPVNMMLGELSLWSGHYLEAAQYYHDFLTLKEKPRQSYTGWVSWREIDGTSVRISDNYSVISDIITMVPMESSQYEGTITQLPNIYCSTKDNNYFNEVYYSESAIEQSAEQIYGMVKSDLLGRKDTVFINEETYGSSISYYNNRAVLGDLRLYSNVRKSPYNNSQNSNYNTEVVENQKFIDEENVTLYRSGMIYLHYAEALNRAGFPTAAFTVLKYGMSDDLMEKDRVGGDPIAAEERAKAGNILTFDKEYFYLHKVVGNNMYSSNTAGIHARGCGDVDANWKYTIPSGDSLAVLGIDTMLWVEDRIIEEEALEGIFEGFRYYDLMRIADRRNNPNYLIDAISKRNGKNNVNSELASKLSDRKNWYLPFNK